MKIYHHIILLKGTNAMVMRAGPVKETGIIKAMIERHDVIRHDVGILKRPHTLSRGICTPAIQHSERATSMPPPPTTTDQECTANLPGKTMVSI